MIDGNIGFGASNTADQDRGWVVTVTSSAADPLAGAAALTDATWAVVVAGTPEGVLYTVSPAAQPSTTSTEILANSHYFGLFGVDLGNISVEFVRGELLRASTSGTEGSARRTHPARRDQAKSAAPT